MLFSPAAIHANLSNVTSSSDTSLPHTALLITPAGQIMSWVSTPPGYDYYGDNIDGTDGAGDADGEAAEDGDEEYDGDAIGDEVDEPWLDTPERLRLILGLVAEYTEGIVNKIESELGKLLVSPIDIGTPPSVAEAVTPAVRPPASSSFLLILNGSSKSDWAKLAAKANEFKEAWAEAR